MAIRVSMTTASRACEGLLGRPAAWAISLTLATLGCGDDTVTPTASATTADPASTTGHEPGTATADATHGTDPSTSTSGDASEGTTGGTTTTGEPDHGALLELELAPADTVLAVDLDTPAVLTYAAIGRYEDGALVDVTAATRFAEAGPGPALGVMSGADLELPPFSALFLGTTRITATFDGRTAETGLTVVAHARTGAAAQALFVLPHDAPAQAQALAFDTGLDRLDVVVNVEATGSMGGPIADLQATLGTTVIPGAQAAVADAWLGISAFMDFPIAPFGIASCDQPFVLLQPVTSSSAAAQAAALGLTDGPFGGPIGCGGDPAASHVEALWQLATGEGLAGPAPTLVAPSDVGLGGAGFRAGALPVIVSITNAPTHDPGGPACHGGLGYDTDPAVLAVAATRSATEAALAAICGRVVTMAVSDFDPSCGPLADGVALAEATGATVYPAAWDLLAGGRPPGCAADQCCTGLDHAGVAPADDGRCPLALRIPFGGGGLGSRVAEAVALVADHAPFTVTAAVAGTTASIDGTPLPPGIDTAGFIASVTPLWHGPVPTADVPDPVLTAVAFEGVVPNTPVAFEVVARNELVPATRAPQLFSATISVRADGCSELDDQQVLVLVPALAP